VLLAADAAGALSLKMAWLEASFLQGFCRAERGFAVSPPPVPVKTQKPCGGDPDFTRFWEKDTDGVKGGG